MKFLLELVMWFVKISLLIDAVNKSQPEIEEKKAQLESLEEKFKALLDF